jgi:DNA-binding LytR/AlgR family response regulator
MNAIIIEDENLLARQLAAKIKILDAGIKILELIPSLKVARRWLSENAEPDLIFMDIQLSDGVSFELFEDFQLKCPVVFITAFDEYAIRAFKVNGVDYLLKPVDDNELLRAIEKCRRQLQPEQAMAAIPNWNDLLQAISVQASMPVYKEKFIVHQRNQWVSVNTKDIACFYRDNLNYIFSFDGSKYILDNTSLDETEELLDPKVYYRANRQCIIHIDAIQSVRLHDNLKLSLHLKAPLKLDIDISRDKAPSFKKWFDR